MKQIELEQWAERADSAQEALDIFFWNEAIGMYDIETPCLEDEDNEVFHYWWMAHAVDVLVDGLQRTGADKYRKRLAALHAGLLRRNGGVWPNELYDDMEWMALAWLRAYQATGEELYKETVLILWTDIRTGWNSHSGAASPGRNRSSITRTPRPMHRLPSWPPGCIRLSEIRRTWSGRIRYITGSNPVWWTRTRASSGMG